MRSIENLVAGHEITDIRAAFYYLSRYLKQADYFTEYQKDFFEDDYQSAPSDVAKKLTFSLIKFIEEHAGKKASEFDDEEYIKWMDEIDAVESNLDPEPSNMVKQAADQMIDELFLPEIGKSSK